LPTDQDRQLAQAAVAQKRLTRAQADVLLAEVSAAEVLGREASFARLAVERGRLSEADCRDLAGTGDEPPDGEERLGGFALIDRISRGGMGTVYRARQASTGRIVALKVLSQRLADDAAYVERFIREARAAGKLNHRNIVQAIDAGSDRGHYFLAMEYVNGESAAERIARIGPLDEDEAVDIARQIANGLHHAHTHGGLLHRDVKPDNILIAPDGTAKLADLGIACDVRADTEPRAGGTFGSPEYVSPEQIRGEPDIDARTDVYSLGATLFFLLTGEPPYPGENPRAVMRAQLRARVPDPAQLRPELSNAVAAVVRRCLHKDRARRFATAEALRSALDAATEPVQSGRAAATPARLRGTRPGSTVSGAACRADRSSRRKRPRRAHPARKSYVGSLIAVGVLGIAVLVMAGLVARELRRNPLSGRTDDHRLTHARPGGAAPGHQQPSGVGPVVRSTRPAGAATPPGTTRANSRTAREMYLRARRLMEHHAPAPWRALRELQSARSGAQNSAFEAKITELIEQAEAARDERAAAALAALDATAAAYVRAERYGAAIDVYDAFPPQLATGHWPDRVAARRASVRTAAAEAYRALERRAGERAASAEYEAAMKQLEGVRAWGIPELTRAAEARKSVFARQQSDHLKRIRAARRKRRVAGLRRVLVPLRKRQWAEARRVANGLAELAEDEADVSAFRELAADVARLEGLWSRLDALLKRKQPGTSLRLRELGHTLVSYKDGRIRARLVGPGTLETLHIRDMRRRDVVDLLEPYVASRNTDPAVHLAIGLLHAFDRDPAPERARKAFATVRSLGRQADAARCERYLEWIPLADGG
jgi:serine/threonine-protein kinase